jgi:hypothetical protein
MKEQERSKKEQENHVTWVIILTSEQDNTYYNEKSN